MRENSEIALILLMIDIFSFFTKPIFWDASEKAKPPTTKYNLIIQNSEFLLNKVSQKDKTIFQVSPNSILHK